MKHLLRVALLAAPTSLASAALACGCTGPETVAATATTTQITTLASAKVSAKPVAKSAKASAKPVYQFKLKTLDGKDADLSKYQGQALLIVNTASKCGFTPQYAGLQALHQKYEAKGLTVLGFPSADFGGQELDSDAEIGAFCQKNYGVTFPLFAKSSVKGANQTPLFKFLTADANPELKGEIGWNFEKFLIGRDGKLVARFKSGVKPDSAELLKAVDAALAQK